MNASEPRPSAVAADGTLTYSSVSALKKFLTCEAAWWFRYVKRLPDPSGAGAKESSECHTRVEHYLKTGENVLGPIELRAHRLGLFPTPGSDLLIEATLPLDADGVPFVTKIDCIDPRRVIGEGLLVINDWKFKKDVAKYGAKPAELWDPHDLDSGLQMVGYGEAVRRAVFNNENFQGTQTIRLRHVEVDKRRDWAEPVEVDVPVEDFAYLWETATAGHIPRMRQVAKISKAEDVPWKKACFKYGGCAFRNQCPHFKSSKPEDQSFRLNALFKKEEKDMGLLKTIMTKEATLTPPPSTQAPAAQSAPVTTFAAVLPSDAPKSAAVEAPKASAIMPDCTTCGTSLTPDNSSKKVSGEYTHIGCVAKAAPAAMLDPTIVPSAQSAAAPTVEAPKRGRPPKTEAATITTAPVTGTASGTAQAGFTLFVGCAPRNGAAPFSVYVDQLERIALEGIKANFKTDDGSPMVLDDIRFATGPVIGFGKWKAVLARLAKESPPPPGNYKILSLGMDERVDAVVAALEGTAIDVVMR